VESGAAGQLRDRLPFVHRLLVHKYYFDELYERFIARARVRSGASSGTSATRS
jgi:hypothetical protein